MSKILSRGLVLWVTFGLFACTGKNSISPVITQNNAQGYGGYVEVPDAGNTLENPFFARQVLQGLLEQFPVPEVTPTKQELLYCRSLPTDELRLYVARLLMGDDLPSLDQGAILSNREINIQAYRDIPTDTLHFSGTVGHEGKVYEQNFQARFTALTGTPDATYDGYMYVRQTNPSALQVLAIPYYTNHPCTDATVCAGLFDEAGPYYPGILISFDKWAPELSPFGQIVLCRESGQRPVPN